MHAKTKDGHHKKTHTATRPHDSHTAALPSESHRPEVRSNTILYGGTGARAVVRGVAGRLHIKGWRTLSFSRLTVAALREAFHLRGYKVP